MDSEDYRRDLIRHTAAYQEWKKNGSNNGHLSLMRHDELSTLTNTLEDRCGGFGDVLKKDFDNDKHEKQLLTEDEGYYIRCMGLATASTRRRSKVARTSARGK